MAWRARRAGVEELSAVSFCATLRVARSGFEPRKMYRARRLLDLFVSYQSELVELGRSGATRCWKYGSVPTQTNPRSFQRPPSTSVCGKPRARRSFGNLPLLRA